MTNEYGENLSEAANKLRLCPSMPIAAEQLKACAGDINKELRDKVKHEVPQFRNSDNTATSAALRQHLGELTENVIELLSHHNHSNFNFVHKFSHYCAIHQFSMESNLHIYRVCHKIYCQHLRSRVISPHLSHGDVQQALMSIDDFLLEYIDEISTIAAQAYAEQSRIITQAAGDKRAELLKLLLDGFDDSDNRVNRILSESGYLEQGQLFCVAVARDVDPKQMLNHERARRMADSIEKLFESQHGNNLIDIRENKVVMIFSTVKRLSGWANPMQDYSLEITRRLAMVGNAAFIGISNDVPSINQIPRAYKQALMVLNLATPVNRVICSTQLSTYDVLIQLSREEISNSLPDWVQDFYRADDKSTGSLSATLRAYAKTNMNILKAGAVLSVHPNTIYSRFNKIKNITGIDARRYHSLTELLLICDIRHSRH